MKVGFAIVRFEKRANRQIFVEGQKRASASIKACDDAVGAPDFQNVFARRAVAQFLRLPQVFFFADRTEFRAMFVVMIQKFLARGESDIGANLRRRGLGFRPKCGRGRRRIRLATSCLPNDNRQQTKDRRPKPTPDVLKKRNRHKNKDE